MKVEIDKAELDALRLLERDVRLFVEGWYYLGGTRAPSGLASALHEIARSRRDPVREQCLSHSLESPIDGRLMP